MLIVEYCDLRIQTAIKMKDKEKLSTDTNLMAALKPPKPINIYSTSDLSSLWKRYEETFCTYYEAAELSQKKRGTQVAILLHCAGEGARNRFDKVQFTNAGEHKKDNVEAVLQKF